MRLWRTLRRGTGLPRERGEAAGIDTVQFGADLPTEADLRLCGDLKGRRVLDIGCGAGENAVAMAGQGAHVIAIDASTAQLALGRKLADAAEVRVEWHHGDAADLAFLRADSIDLALGCRLRARGRGSRPSLPPGAPRAAGRRRVRVLARAPDAPRGRPRRQRARRPPARAARSAPVVLRHESDRHRHATTNRSGLAPHDRRRVLRRCTAPATASTCSSSPKCCAPPIPAPRSPRRSSGAPAKRASRSRARVPAPTRGDARSPPPRRSRLLRCRISSRKFSASPTMRPGGTSSTSHHRVAVERGPELRQLLLFLQLGDPRLELVHPARERGGLLRVARRAVATRQLVEIVEQRPGVAHVAADRTVGPAHAVRVEPQVQLDELGHVVDDVVRVAQRVQALARHPRADDVVVVERHALRPVAAGARLPDVVQAARRGAASGAATSSRRPRSCARARPCADGSDPARAPSR